jgi:exodeoxyribonuclease (lambda-induced)
LINGSLWLLGRKWCDLILWAPDLPSRRLFVYRINRNDDEIEKLESDLVSFAKMVSEYEAKLMQRLAA